MYLILFRSFIVLLNSSSDLSAFENSRFLVSNLQCLISRTFSLTVFKNNFRKKIPFLPVFISIGFLALNNFDENLPTSFKEVLKVNLAHDVTGNTAETDEEFILSGQCM